MAKTKTYQLAQLNIGLIKGENMEDPIMAGFAARLDEINALAEQSEGFIWRLKDESNNATSFQVFDNPRQLVNLSVWESIEALEQFTYHSDHVRVMRQRKEWFHKMDSPHLVLWWIPEGHILTLEEAKSKLEHLQQHGASAKAFTFSMRFAPVEEI